MCSFWGRAALGGITTLSFKAGRAGVEVQLQGLQGWGLCRSSPPLRASGSSPGEGIELLGGYWELSLKHLCQGQESGCPRPRWRVTRSLESSKLSHHGPWRESRACVHFISRRQSQGVQDQGHTAASVEPFSQPCRPAACPGSEREVSSGDSLPGVPGRLGEAGSPGRAPVLGVRLCWPHAVDVPGLLA